MNYTPVFGAKARPQWRALDPQLQELVLDELERLAADPPEAPSGEHTHDIVHDDKASGARHYLFLRLRVRHRARTITVTTLGHHVKL